MFGENYPRGYYVRLSFFVSERRPAYVWSASFVDYGAFCWSRLQAVSQTVLRVSSNALFRVQQTVDPVTKLLTKEAGLFLVTKRKGGRGRETGGRGRREPVLFAVPAVRSPCFTQSTAVCVALAFRMEGAKTTLSNQQVNTSHFVPKGSRVRARYSSSSLCCLPAGTLFVYDRGYLRLQCVLLYQF